MRNEAASDALKVWLYAGASVVLGAWISPLLYNAGKALAEVSSVKVTNDPLEWLAGICRGADFPQFFTTSLLIAGLILLLPFIEWLRGGRGNGSWRSGSLRLPDRSQGGVTGQRLRPNPQGLRQAVTGFLLVSTLFLLLAGALIPAGVLTWKTPGDALPKVVLRGLGVAAISAVIQEVLFYGVAMGIFLRAMRPSAAVAMAAIFFALVHFFNPPTGLNVADPDASGIGFELLGKITTRFSEPPAILGTLAPLLALGGVLAYARWRTASLWLPLGLHAGWIFVSSLLASVTMTAGHQGSIGTSVGQGVVSLVGILLAGILASHILTSDVPTDTPA